MKAHYHVIQQYDGLEPPAFSRDESGRASAGFGGTTDSHGCARADGFQHPVLPAKGTQAMRLDLRIGRICLPHWLIAMHQLRAVFDNSPQPSVCQKFRNAMVPKPLPSTRHNTVATRADGGAGVLTSFSTLALA